ncbi:membrane-associated protein [Ulvibacter sp. MAR_2010_11]|uniref:VTT domain-containing protein n=1 Tax=Ulvibacter sp. MAR_2010_11 TaxID=1250229 RepID=UPI000C2C6390|nr:VTT domain-containing protein [Ulvibacter sp. MAR_2010_11]PKA82008.1 membrane-associated protein [Ulvibacter sp. MAR_2010_11]
MDGWIEIILHTDDALLGIVAQNVLFAYIFLFMIILLETGLIIFPFLPGDGLLFSAGVVAASTELNVWILLVVLIIAAVLGNVLNYSVGKVLGNRIRQSDNFIIKKYIINNLPRTQVFYDKHGGNAIVFGRFFPIIRTYIPFFAGIVKVEKSLFIEKTIIGAVSWISLFLLLGFFVGEIEWVKNNYGLIFLCLIIITLIPLLFSLIKKIISKK